MKHKRHISSILQNADEQTAQQIAELSPPADAETKERLYQRIQERMEQPVSVTEERFTVRTVHRAPWGKITAAAACLLIAGGAAGGVLLSGRSGGTSPLTPGQSVASTQFAASEQPTEPPQPTDKMQKEWTQEEVYALCMDSLDNLRKYGRFSCSVAKTTAQKNALVPELQAELELDFEAEIYNSAAQYTIYDQETITIQENQWYYADGCEFQLSECLTDDHAQGKGVFSQPEQNFVLRGRGGSPSDFPINTAFLMETYLSDFSKWEVVGTDVFDYVFIEDPTTNITHAMQRECIVLELSGDVFGEQFGTRSQVMVDAEIGMWLQIVYYDADGNTSRTNLNDLKFGSDAKITHPYNIGQEILNGDYVFDTEYELPDSYLKHPMEMNTEE